MCGITGFLDLAHRTTGEEIERRIRAMADTLHHRGPDEGRVWTDGAAGVALGFRRLAIIDLTQAGSQPMASASGRFVIAFNGEFYNAEEMRQALGGAAPRWRGHSDTEAFLELAALRGAEAALKATLGMFALALWDRAERRLVLARDRLGKKPLYWTLQGGHLLFGSELRALRAHPAFTPTLDRDALAGYIRRGYFLHPHTVYKGVQQLPPGHMLTLESGREPTVKPYWSLDNVVVAGGEKPVVASDAEAINQLETLLADAVRRRMVSDVPLGAFLSGGYDSSTVVALMCKAGGARPKTYSIGFREKAYDESSFASAVATHLGTDHTELIVTPEEAQAVIPRLPDIYDEPFADSSQVPTYLVSELARRHVTVALSGDGGDELFAGYNRYVQGALYARRIAPVPMALRRGGAAALRTLSPETWDGLARMVPERMRPRLVGDKLYKLADVAAETGDGFYHKLTSLWSEPADVVPGAVEPGSVVTDPDVARLVPDFVARMQYRDTLTYLPGDILTKVDRASMAVSLEARNPLLDHRVVEFSWALPAHLKLRGSEAKWILRQVAYRHVPARLLDRPKTGFGVPIDAWLRGPLRDWAEDLLSEGALKRSGLVAHAPVRKRWAEHLSGRRNWQHALWVVLMLEAWQRRHHPGGI